MSQTSADNPLDLRDPEQQCGRRSDAEEVAAHYHRTVERFEVNAKEIVANWKAGWGRKRKRDKKR